MRELKRVVLHCSATRPDQMVTVADIRRWHVEGRRWSDIGYHAVLDRAGVWHAGRPLARVGAHTLGHNTDSIGLCLLGGFGAAATDVFSTHFTERQRVALRPVCHALLALGLTIHGHNEFAAKGCPGFNVHDWLREG